MAPYSVVDDSDELRDESVSKSSEKRHVTVLLSTLIVVAIALASWFTVTEIDKRNYEQEQRELGYYSGEPITEAPSVDFGEIEETNEEGIKVDKDGFIPVSLDGGPVFTYNIETEGLDDNEFTDMICENANQLDVKRSRENRYELMEFIKSNAAKISDPDIRQAAENLTGYDFNNQSIAELVRLCQ